MSQVNEYGDDFCCAQLRENATFEYGDGQTWYHLEACDGGWAINDGDGYNIDPMKFCPFCGTKLKPPPEKSFG